MVLKGEVVKVIFRNIDNGYTVLDLTCSGENITAVGIFPDVYEGMILELTGDYKFHSRHGMQFLAENVKVLPPSDTENIEKFLKSGLFKGIGEVTAGAIVKRFGDESLEIIENEPEKLAEIKGIGLKRAIGFSEDYKSRKNMQETLLFLQNFDISLNLALKIYKQYENATEKIIKENPYKLIDDIERVGFLTADKIAQEMGIDKESNFRIRSAIIYTLKEAASRNGHTYLPEDVLIKQVIQLLDFDKDKTEKVLSDIEDMLLLTKLKDVELAEHRAIMLYESFITEKSIARRLSRLDLCHRAPEFDFNKQITEFEELYHIKLHENQRTAVNDAINSGVHIITGGPGTGKTTIIRCLLYILKSINLKYLLCAPTGRAAKRMSEATGEEAKTIHRLLDLDFKDGKGYFTYNDNFRLPADVIIVDEVSMVDEYVFNSLLKAIEDGSSIIIVGDKDQLASVGAGNVLADLINCNCFKITRLTQIYRQAEDSLIITNAHKINSGTMPVLDNYNSDFFFVSKENPVEVLNTVVEMCSTRLPNYLNIDANEIQVLCPMKKGIAGVINLNKELREILNKKTYNCEELHSGEYSFRIGDKVMQIVNNYEQEWIQYFENYAVNGRGVFNGEIGFITDIEHDKTKFTVRFEDNKEVVYSLGDIDQIEPAYAVSVHKSQGSEFTAVILALTQSNFFLMTRNLLYTAVTRAKSLVVIVGTKELVHKMVKNNYTAKRFSCLKHFIIEGYKVDGE